MFGSALVYCGIVTILAAMVALVRPFRRLGLGTRLRAAMVWLLGLLLVAAGFAVPAPEVRIGAPQSLLDQFAPVYQFHETHSVRIAAPREEVWRAIRITAADDIFLFRALVWVRRLGRKGPESILNAPEREPLLDVAARTGFLKLAEEPGREIVVGTVVAAPRRPAAGALASPDQYRTRREPGFALASMNFQVEEMAAGVCRVTTETRVFATDARTARRFAAYWRVIYPGSAFIRRMWLRAIARRAYLLQGAKGVPIP